MHRISQSLSYLHNFVLDTINSMMNLKQFCPIILICVEIKWPSVNSQWLYLVVVIINNQVLNKIKIAVKICHGRGLNMMKL